MYNILMMYCSEKSIRDITRKDLANLAKVKLECIFKLTK